MKNYDETINAVFSRIDEYKTAQKYKRKMITKTVCSICLVALIGFGVWQIGLFDTAPLPTDNTSQPSISTKAKVSKNNKTDTPTEKKNDIVINKIDNIASHKYNICLLYNDLVIMNKEELKEYYGTDIFPAVPSDLLEWETENGYGIYKRDGGTGEVYWDNTVLNYSNDDFTRSVNIELSKDGMPYSDYGELSADCDKSIINNIEVGIGKTESSYYLVEFVYKNVGFRMIIEGLSEEEIVSVVASLIQ